MVTVTKVSTKNTGRHFKYIIETKIRDLMQNKTNILVSWALQCALEGPYWRLQRWTRDARELWFR